jgi:hypothetical protein
VLRGLISFSPIALIALAGCPSPSDNLAGGGGQGDADAGCPSGPMAMLHLHIKAVNGPVPPDTRLLVNWSAGAEPPFDLDDPATWGKPEDGGNVICEVDPALPPPKDLAELVCHLWTSGATHVQVRASTYQPYEGTLKPKVSATCEGPVPTAVSVSLWPMAAPDAGPEAGM